MLSLIKVNDTDQVYAIVRTSPRAAHVVRAGDLVPAGTMLVTRGLQYMMEKSVEKMICIFLCFSTIYF